MKKVLAVTAAALVAQVGLAASASADTVNLPYGGSATLTVPDVTLTPGGGCINHYGTFSISHIDYWNVDLTANGPTSWPASDYLYGDGPQSRIVDLILCPGTDGPGLYTVSGLVTVEDPYSYNQQEVLISDQFTITNPAPPPPPPPPPPAPVYTDVTGTVAKKMVTGGVKFTFKSAATPAGTLPGNQLKWVIKYDGRSKRINQGPGEIDKKTVRFDSGKHVVKVFRNGVQVMKATVRA